MSSKPPRKTLYVIRHGVTEWNEAGRIVGHTDLGLSEGGREQAAGTRRLLSGCRIDRAWTSPLRRTRETAEIVLDGHEVEAEEEPRLIELALAGWEGKSRAELSSDPAWETWLTAPDTIATPEGERLVDVQARASAALRDAVTGTREGGAMALFTHGGVARILTLTLLGMPLGAYQKLRLDCASVAAFEVNDDATLARLLVLNLTEPLLALSGRPVG